MIAPAPRRPTLHAVSHDPKMAMAMEGLHVTSVLLEFVFTGLGAIPRTTATASTATGGTCSNTAMAPQPNPIQPGAPAPPEPAAPQPAIQRLRHRHRARRINQIGIHNTRIRISEPVRGAGSTDCLGSITF